MPCTHSTQKRPPLAQAPALMSVNWASLPVDLVRSVGDCVLGDNDIDDYMAFRAVCQDWRCATKGESKKEKKEKEKVDADDNLDLAACFIPTKWALLDRDNDLVTLVNVETGRFLCKRIPFLLRFFFVGMTTGGLILLGESSEPHRACILNPFTGFIAHFKVRIPYRTGVRAVAITRKPPLTVFISTGIGEIIWADQSMETFKHFSMAYPNKPTCITSFDDNLYTTDRYGSIYVSTLPANDVTTTIVRPMTCRSAMDFIMNAISPVLDTAADIGDQALMSGRYYLVESAGDLLLVTKPLGFTIDQPVVRKVNMVTQTIEPISTIGSRALFVSHVKCLSINVDKFPSIQGGCVYFLPSRTGPYFDVIGRSIVHVADNVVVEVTPNWVSFESLFRPFTLTKVITDYCLSIHYTKLYEMMMWSSNFSYEGSESDESSSSELDDKASSSEPVDD